MRGSAGLTSRIRLICDPAAVLRAPRVRGDTLSGREPIDSWLLPACVVPVVAAVSSSSLLPSDSAVSVRSEDMSEAWSAFRSVTRMQKHVCQHSHTLAF